MSEKHHKYQLMRKAFQELTNIKYTYAPVTLLFSDAGLGRWISFRSAISFTDRCLVKEESPGEIICIIPDVSKAKKNTDDTSSSINYVLAKLHELNAEASIKEAIDCLAVKYPNSSVIFFDRIYTTESIEELLTYIGYIKKYLPGSWNAVINLEGSSQALPDKDKEELEKTTGLSLIENKSGQVRVHTTISEMTDFPYIYDVET